MWLLKQDRFYFFLGDNFGNVGYGLYDMIGNVEEWVWNTFDDDRGECCSRGGSFYDYAKECNVMLCGHIGMKNLSRNYLGLRLARLLSDK